jgi:formylmethanofuran dehydrogenase subunit E-like metal-binding protein
MITNLLFKGTREEHVFTLIYGASLNGNILTECPSTVNEEEFRPLFVAVFVSQEMKVNCSTAHNTRVITTMNLRKITEEIPLKARKRF